jgi:hypothetical protein
MLHNGLLLQEFLLRGVRKIRKSPYPIKPQMANGILKSNDQGLCDTVSQFTAFEIAQKDA